MKIFKNEQAWKEYLVYLDTKDPSKDSDGNDPDLFPCMLVAASYHRNNTGRYEWHRTFIYPGRAQEFLEEVGYKVEEPK